MQVFKAFLKVLNKHKGQMIMYVCIFAGILGGITMSSDKEKESGYTSTKVKYAVVDYDESTIGEELIEYLSKTGERKNLSSDDEDLIKDEIYNGRIECVLRIKKGFSDELKKSDIDNISEFLEVVAIPDSMQGKCFESEIENFVSMYHYYSVAGFTDKESAKKTVEALGREVTVSLPDGDKVKETSKMFTYFKYLAWVLIMMCVMGVTPVLQVFMKKDLRNRIQSSAYRFTNMSREILLGVVVTGLLISLVILGVAFSFFNTEIFSAKCLLFVVNMFCYMMVCMSLTFLISKCTVNQEIVSLLANIVGLGMSFLCGVFVPMELLSEGVIKLAHFFPAYWYVMAASEIDLSAFAGIETIIKYCGIELLFAAAIMVVGLIVERRVKAA